MNTEYYDDSRLGKNLTMPLETTLQLQINGLADRFTGVLVGMVTDEYLIIQGKFENITTDLYNGNKTTGRYTHEGTVYSFSSNLMGVVLTPVELAFITYPEKIEAIELRSQKRIKSFFPAELIISNESYPGVIQDITEKGCKFIIEVAQGKELPPVKINEQLTLAVQFSEIKDKETISGEARNIQLKVDFDKEEMRIGVKFHEDKSAGLRKIAEYISSVEFL